MIWVRGSHSRSDIIQPPSFSPPPFIVKWKKKKKKKKVKHHPAIYPISNARNTNTSWTTGDERATGPLTWILDDTMAYSLRLLFFVALLQPSDWSIRPLSPEVSRFQIGFNKMLFLFLASSCCIIIRNRSAFCLRLWTRKRSTSTRQRQRWKNEGNSVAPFFSKCQVAS